MNASPRKTDKSDLRSVDFYTLAPGKRPNWIFVAPAFLDHPDRKAIPDVKGTRPEWTARLAHAMDGEPRTTLLGHDPERSHYRWQQKSALMGFVDLMDVGLVEHESGAFGIAIYSRAITGYRDFGVNAKRVARVMERLGISAAI